MSDYSDVVLRDQHAEVLRLFLVGDPEGVKPFENPGSESEAVAHTLMIYAAFAVAVQRKFSPSFMFPQVVRYVADLRISLKKDEEEIDARVTENIIRAVLGDTSVDEEPTPDTRTAVMAELAVLDDLLPETVADEAGLDEFLRESVEYAHRWLATRQAGERASAG
ncbi:hypothetical protein [Actinomadura sp. 3N407]|uniref:hypothetical protein n=1 Tax=Actinomadura sp. 3N407 TaxID=3457423 RepID=UPI003FCC7986